MIERQTDILGSLSSSELSRAATPTETFKSPAAKQSGAMRHSASTYGNIIFIILALLVNGLLAKLVHDSFRSGHFVVGIGLTVAASLAGLGISCKNVPAALRIVVRITLGFSVFYVVASRMHLPPTVVGDLREAGLVVNVLWLPAALFGVIGFFRPSMGLFPLYYIHAQKLAVTTIFGADITPVDYITIVDTCGLIIVGCGLFPIYRRVARLSPLLSVSSARHRDPPGTQLNALEALFLAAIALHFGNYFFGALGKMAIGENPLYWATDNRTQYLILASLETGVNPLSFSSRATRTAYEFFSEAVVFFNFLTFTGQLICVATIIRPRLAMYTTIFFDLMHAGIFVFTGIFFWKFILLNFAIVLGLRKMSNRMVPLALATLLMTLVITSPLIFHITNFRWLDSPAMNSVKMTAVNSAGEEFPVPPSFFLNMSVTFNQHRLITPRNGPFPTYTWGTTLSLADMYQAFRCDLPGITAEMPANAYYIEKAKLVRLIQKYHEFAMANLDSDGKMEFDLYPHHMFTVPWAFTEFRNLDLRTISHYIYAIEAICLGYDETGFTRKVVWRDSFEIDLPH